MPNFPLTFHFLGPHNLLHRRPARKACPRSCPGWEASSPVHEAVWPPDRTDGDHKPLPTLLFEWARRGYNSEAYQGVIATFDWRWVTCSSAYGGLPGHQGVFATGWTFGVSRSFHFYLFIYYRLCLNGSLTCWRRLHVSLFYLAFWINRCILCTSYGVISKVYIYTHTG